MVLPISLGEHTGQKLHSHRVEPGYRDEAELDLLQWRLLVELHGNEMRDVSSPFGRMQSLIWFGFP